MFFWTDLWFPFPLAPGVFAASPRCWANLAIHRSLGGGYPLVITNITIGKP